MVELALGVALGAAGGYYVKGKLEGNSNEQMQAAKQRELDSIYAENEKLRKRNREMERQIEDLLAENKKLYKQSKDQDDNQDDLLDDLEDARKEVKRLSSQNDDLARKLQEYKIACNGYELEIERLKEKLG